VSWVRRRGDELHLLTIGLDTYASDSRFSLALEKPNDWRLLLRSATERDGGVYECQVSAHPPLIRTVYLTVSASFARTKRGKKTEELLTEFRFVSKRKCHSDPCGGYEIKNENLKFKFQTVAADLNFRSQSEKVLSNSKLHCLTVQSEKYENSKLRACINRHGISHKGKSVIRCESTCPKRYDVKGWKGSCFLMGRGLSDKRIEPVKY
ncbi:unnamed protein product, partial [Heterotrigona itama]